VISVFETGMPLFEPYFIYGGCISSFMSHHKSKACLKDLENRTLSSLNAARSVLMRSQYVALHSVQSA
jgi:hypothetical protein